MTASQRPVLALAARLELDKAVRKIVEAERAEAGTVTLSVVAGMVVAIRVELDEAVGKSTAAEETTSGNARRGGVAIGGRGIEAPIARRSRWVSSWTGTAAKLFSKAAMHEESDDGEARKLGGASGPPQDDLKTGMLEDAPLVSEAVSTYALSGVWSPSHSSEDAMEDAASASASEWGITLMLGSKCQALSRYIFQPVAMLGHHVCSCKWDSKPPMCEL